jgi:class 3 adenylate cyclase/tetratricopeptide (TPR) repeat protein
VLPRLTAEDLKEIGIAAVGDRRRLLDAIAALRTPPLKGGHASPSELEGERRPVTVLFADMVGYSALAGQLDAEEIHLLLKRFFQRIDRIVEAHGGHVDKHIGDCVMAVFGAPVAHGNDAERAVEAALGIRAAMAELSVEAGRPVQIHVGVAGGQVLAGGTGSAERPDVTVTGASVNLAARLADAAPPDEILIAETVWCSLADRLDCGEAETLAVKGFALPVRCRRLHGLRPAPPRRALVGRAPELERLRAALATCRQNGRGQAFLVRGEAGIGKTRLVEELQDAARRDGFACHVGLVLDFGTGKGRDAMRSLVRSLLGLEAGSGEAEARAAAAAALAKGLVEAGQAVFLNDLLDLPQEAELRLLLDAMDHATRSAGKRRTLADLVAAMSRRQNLLLVVEDLHWADRTMLSYLAGLAEAVADCPALLVMTSRIEGDPQADGWPGPDLQGAICTIELGPLRREDALVIAGSLVEAADRFAERCVQRAGGNPLFLEQLLRHAEDSAETSVPGSVQSLVQARLDRLEPLDRLALQAASALGQQFERTALDFLLDQDGYAPERLVAQALVRPRGEAFLFAHALIRDAVYDSLLKSRRRALHRKAADWYASRDPQLRAEHLDRADDPAAPAAYLDAAQVQAREHRYELALRLAERGLALARERAERFALACLKGDLLHDLGDMAGAGPALEEALAAAESDAERCRAWIGRAAVKRITDDLDGAMADLDLAQDAACSHGLLAEQARIRFLRGNLCFPKGDIEGCLGEHRLSLELARQAGSPELQAAALGGLGDAEYARGRMRSAYRHFSSCVELCRAHGFGRIEAANLPMAAITRWHAGDLPGALGESLAAIEVAARIGHARAEIIAHHAAYFCRTAMGKLEAGMVHAEASLALSRRLTARRFEAESLAFRADVLRLAGDRARARGDLAEALAICRETGMAYVGPVVLGLLALATDDPAERAAALVEGEALLAAGSISHNHLLFLWNAIETCLDSGQWQRVEHYAAALERYCRPEPLPWVAFVTRRGRTLAAAALGPHDAAMPMRLRALRDEAKRLDYLISLPAIEAALAGQVTRDGAP